MKLGNDNSVLLGGFYFHSSLVRPTVFEYLCLEKIKKRLMLFFTFVFLIYVYVNNKYEGKGRLSRFIMFSHNKELPYITTITRGKILVMLVASFPSKTKIVGKGCVVALIVQAMDIYSFSRAKEARKRMIYIVTR